MFILLIITLIFFSSQFRPHFYFITFCFVPLIFRWLHLMVNSKAFDLSRQKGGEVGSLYVGGEVEFRKPGCFWLLAVIDKCFHLQQHISFVRHRFSCLSVCGFQPSKPHLVTLSPQKRFHFRLPRNIVVTIKMWWMRNWTHSTIHPRLPTDLTKYF